MKGSLSSVLGVVVKLTQGRRAQGWQKGTLLKGLNGDNPLRLIEFLKKKIYPSKDWSALEARNKRPALAKAPLLGKGSQPGDSLMWLNIQLIRLTSFWVWSSSLQALLLALLLEWTCRWGRSRSPYLHALASPGLHLKFLNWSNASLPLRDGVAFCGWQCQVSGPQGSVPGSGLWYWPHGNENLCHEYWSNEGGLWGNHTGAFSRPYSLTLSRSFLAMTASCSIEKREASDGNALTKFTHSFSIIYSIFHSLIA